jgi:uncharacterized protein (TIGR02246 family)
MNHSTLLSIAAAIVLSGCASAPSNGGAPRPAAAACTPITEPQVAALFDRWNTSLGTGDPQKVVSNYADTSILLATVSNQPRLTPAEKKDYFEHFLDNKPSGVINQRFTRIGCNTALDAGIYTFTFAKTGAVVKARYSYTYEFIGGQWLITSHHSSAMPEK